MIEPEHDGASPLPASLSSVRVLRHLLESSPDATVGIGRDGRIVLVNTQTERLFGYARDELVGQPLEMLMPPRFRGAHEGHRGGYFADPHTRPMGAGLELFGLRRDGSEFAAEISLSSLETEHGRLATAAIRDVSDRRRVEAAGREAEERFRGVFEHSGIGMAVVALAGERAGRPTEVNGALCAITGYEHDQLVRMSTSSLLHPDELAQTRDGIARLLRGEYLTFHRRCRYLHASGDPIWVELTVAVVRDADGRPLYRIDQVQDASERNRFETELLHLASHDSLTGLLNRRRFGEELDRELALARRYGSAGAALILDLDHFKYVNDSLGHSVGDELIARVAAAFRERLRETDVIARLGGDEFGVILPRADEQRALGVAEDLLAAAREQLTVQSRRVTVSIGVAPFHGDGELTAEDLLVEADIAMYDAKEAGRDRVGVYDPARHRQVRMQAHLSWTDRLRRALDGDGFVLHAQPILGLTGDTRPRHELLLRIVGDDGELVMPGTFLYIAERFGLAAELDHWVARRAIDLLAEHQRAGIDASFEINLSAHSVADGALIDLLADRIAATEVDPRGLCLELTETAAIVNVDSARSFAGRLADLGCEFALDDFGAGFASFYYLKHLDFDYVKIDGEFIKEIASSHTDQLIVRSIVQLVKDLGKRTIAEFVGDQQTLDLLRDLGVDYAQGYFVGRPAPIEEIGPGSPLGPVSP